MNWYKKAWDLPGDPSLPPGVTDKMIGDQFGSPDEDVASKQEGETEVNVNWLELNAEWQQSMGEVLPALYSGRQTSSALLIKYLYDYDYNSNKANNIKVLFAHDYAAKRDIVSKDLLEFMGEYFENEILNDIGISEQDNKIERQPGYNPMEQDRREDR